MILNRFLIILWWILRIYLSIMIVGIILTWFPRCFDYKIPRAIRKMSDWYLSKFSGIVVVGSLDFTTVIGILLYEGVLDLLALAI